MKKYAVIVAGGAGVRMGTEVPKQFLLLQGKAVLWWTLETWLGVYDDLEIILVVPEAYLESAKVLVNGFGGGSGSAVGDEVGAGDGRVGEEGRGVADAGRRIRVVSGGDTRFHSVRNGLALIAEKNAIIFVHDGVRCLVSAALIQRCYEQALQLGSAIPVIDCRDSVRLAEDEGRSKPIDRSRIKLVQTPQTFKGEILLPAYTQDHQESFTDEATVVEVSGQAVYLIDGEMTNIKITTPMDMAIAEVLLGRR
jgi:2-C-methyl-D-erythritol 4-phosphate cytidylyltransferase